MSAHGNTDIVQQLAQRILQEFNEAFGPARLERLSDEELELIRSASSDAAKVVLLSAAGLGEEAALEKRHAEAQLLNIASIGAAEVTRQLWSAAATALRAAIAVLA